VLQRPKPPIPPPVGAGAPRRGRRKSLEAALEEFVARGFEAARMEDIAKRAGLSKAAIYLYFPSKVALLEALIEAKVGPLAESVQQIAAMGMADPLTALRMMATAAAYRLSDPNLFAVPRLVIGISGVSPKLRNTIASTSSPRRAARLRA
jgi:AcrR family transcriptional regulator